MTKNKYGKEYAQLSKLKAGDVVTIDDGFTCMHSGRKAVFENKEGLYITCSEGRHYLNADEDDFLIGVYPT
jgi:hypothetical protein